MSDDPQDAVRRLFDALSGSYDAVGVDFFQPIAQGLVRALQPRPSERWLDVGCGRGAVTRPAAEGVGPGGSVTAIDLAPGMVEQARLELGDLGNVDVRLGDAQDPSDELGTFDVVASSLVLFFLPEPAGALTAWRRRLRAGGRIGVTTFGPVDPRWARVDSVFEPFLPPSMRDARTTGKAGPFASDSGMEALLSGAGYTDVRTVLDSIDVRFADADQWEAFTWSVGQRAMWLAVPEKDRPAVRSAAREILAEYEAPDGSVVFQQPVRHTLGRQPVAAIPTR